MDNDLEWLFEKKYELENEDPSRLIRSLSDWDNSIEDTKSFQNLMAGVYSRASGEAGRYIFSYEQFDTKEAILARLNERTNNKYNDEQLTLTPAATVSLFLTIKSLKAKGVKRVLLLTPCYFSLLKNFAKEGFEVVYHHLSDTNDFEIDEEVLVRIVEEQFIDAIIITDPIYCVGIEIPPAKYEKLVSLCNEYNVLLMVDYSIGGQVWNTDEHLLFNVPKLDVLAHCQRFVFIDSPTKRLLLNGLKFSIVYGDVKTIDKIDREAESIYGALNAPQLELVKDFFKEENKRVLTEQYWIKTNHLAENYRLLKSLVQHSAFDLYPTNAGFLTVMYHKKRRIQDTDTKQLSLLLLEKHGIVAMPNNCFGIYKTNKFGWRVNLGQDNAQLALLVQECIRFERELTDDGNQSI